MHKLCLILITIKDIVLFKNTIQIMEQKMKKTAIFALASDFLLLLTPELKSLTTEEVIQLKEKGVSDKTIQLMIQSETGEKEQLKKISGIKEVKTSDNKSEIIYSTGEPSNRKIDAEEQKKMDNAWEMLKKLYIEIEK